MEDDLESSGGYTTCSVLAWLFAHQECQESEEEKEGKGARTHQMKQWYEESEVVNGNETHSKQV